MYQKTIVSGFILSLPLPASQDHADVVLLDLCREILLTKEIPFSEHVNERRNNFYC